MDGILIINKEKNFTSNDVVQIVKHTLKEKVGHIGTLDPNATGVLPLLIGKGTKISKYLVNHDKRYIATLKLGIKTDTADGEGNILEERTVNDQLLNEEYIKNILKSFIGKQTQIPPIYSAIKINGKKLYDYARNGEKVEIPSRKIEIYNLVLLEIDVVSKCIVYEVSCSKGTYIRTLCEDIAKQIGTIGIMKELERVQVGEFKIQDSIKIDELRNNKDNENYLNKAIISVEKLFENNDKVDLDNKSLEKFLNGINLVVQLMDSEYRIYNNGKFIGIGVVENKKLKRDVII